MLGENFAPRHSGKKAITIFVQGNSNPEIGAEGIKFIFKDGILCKSNLELDEVKA